jgi:hypothetical protein
MKRIALTSEITGRLRRSLGEGVNPDDYIVFEAIAANTRPIRQRHPVYFGARILQSTLSDMASLVQAESIPLYEVHQSDVLPRGRVFDAREVDGELRCLFALLKSQDRDTVERIDKGIIDQVSVNFLAKRVACSECGWDYLGADAGWESWFDGVCANGHRIGEDGVHVRLEGVADFGEISLVGRGGAQGARIVQPSESVFASHAFFQRLAASDRAAARVTICTLNTETCAVDLKELTAQIAAQAGEIATLKASIATLQASETSLKGEAETLKATAQAEKERADAAQAAVKDFEKAKQLLATAETFIKDVTKRAIIALGDQDPTVPDDIEDCIKVFDHNQAKLTAILKPGAVSQPTALEEATPEPAPASPAFRVARRR